MKRFKVISNHAAIGIGDVVGISAEQLADRAHLVEVVEKAKDEKSPIKVRAREPLQFKVDETISLETLPRHLADSVQPLDKAETEVEQLAASNAKATKEAKAKAAQTKAAE